MARGATSANSAKAEAKAGASAVGSPTQPDGEPAPLRRMAEMAVGVVFAPIAIAQQALPRSQPALYYAGLAALAVTGLVEVPVAAVVAAGVWVARQGNPSRNT